MTPRQPNIVCRASVHRRIRTWSPMFLHIGLVSSRTLSLLWRGESYCESARRIRNDHRDRLALLVSSATVLVSSSILRGMQARVLGWIPTIRNGISWQCYFHLATDVERLLFRRLREKGSGMTPPSKCSPNPRRQSVRSVSDASIFTLRISRRRSASLSPETRSRRRSCNGHQSHAEVADEYIREALLGSS